MSIPEITEVQRLELKPGDRIIVRTPARLTDEQAAYLKERMRTILRLPDELLILVLPEGMSLEVAELP